MNINQKYYSNQNFNEEFDNNINTNTDTDTETESDNQNHTNTNIYKKFIQKSSNNSYNGLVITILTILYILLITKLADILTADYDDDEIKIERYVMIIYFLSIMGLVIGYIWLTDSSNGNYITKRSLTIGSICMLLYTVFNYWEYLDDYSKLIMISLSISFIIYYVYK